MAGYGGGYALAPLSTAFDLIEITRRLLIGRERQAMNQLVSGVSSADTTFAFNYTLDGIKAGAVLGIGLEEVRVWEVDDSAKTAVVQRGVNGSTSDAHPDLSVVMVDPTYSDFEIMRALNEDLTDLSAPSNGLFRVETVDLTAVSGREGYDFDAPGFLGVLEARWQEPGGVSNDWPLLRDIDITDGLPSSSFPSGRALFITGAQPAAQQAIRVRYKAAFTTFSALTDAVSDTGLPETAYDLPPLGAALRIMSGRPNARAQFSTQGETRRPDEVRVGDVIQAPAALRVQRANRIAAEAGRLAAVWNTYVRDRVRLA